MPIVSVAGSQLHYAERGEGEPMLLIMGVGGSHRSWGEPFLDELARDLRLVTYDNRGVGDSGRGDADFTIAELADDAVALLDALGLESAHLMGVSMGGMIAQEVAIRHPDRVRRFVLGCSYAGGEGSSLTPQDVLRRQLEGWKSGDRERALRTNFEVNVSPELAASEGAYETWREMALAVRVPVGTIMRQLRATATHATFDRLERIAAPTLLVHGTRDQILPVGNSRLMVQRIPDARLVELEGAGHLFWWERPARSAELVREHVRAAAAAG